MLSQQDNELVTRVGPGTPAGELMQSDIEFGYRQGVLHKQQGGLPEAPTWALVGDDALPGRSAGVDERRRPSPEPSDSAIETQEQPVPDQSFQAAPGAPGDSQG